MPQLRTFSSCNLYSHYQPNRSFPDTENPADAGLLTDNFRQCGLQRQGVPATQCRGNAGRQSLLLHHRAVTQRLQERYYRRLRLIVKFEIPEGDSFQDHTVDVTVDLRRGPALRQDVPRIVEVDDLLEVLEHAVVHVGLGEAEACALVHVPDGRHLVLAVVILGHRLPFGVDVTPEESAKAEVDKGIAVRIDRVAVVTEDFVHPIEGVLGVLRHAYVLEGEVREERGLPIGAGDVADVAHRAVLSELDQASELLVIEDACWVKDRLVTLGLAAVLRVVAGVQAGPPVVVEHRVERADLVRGLVGRDRQADSVEHSVDTRVAAVERAGTPDLLEEVGVLRRRDDLADGLFARHILLGIDEKGSECLIGGRVAQVRAGRPAVPEHASDEGAFPRVEVEDWAEGCVGSGRRLAVAEPLPLRSAIDGAMNVGTGDLSGPAGFGRVAARTRLVRGLRDCIEEQLLAELLHGCKPRIGLGRRHAEGEKQDHAVGDESLDLNHGKPPWKQAKQEKFWVTVNGRHQPHQRYFLHDLPRDFIYASLIHSCC